MKTNDLKKLIRSIISKVITPCGYKTVPDDAMYPHATFSFAVNLDDMNREDVLLDVDLWDKSKDTTVIDDLADRLEKEFNRLNAPQDTILPTFYLSGRFPIEDEEKDIQHIVLRIEIQNYER